ncbi:hypothetical protein Ndes2526B_g06396 [Nannochloris sp. 'desiccata']|nr:hypothetical protein KSW81_008162 [Chlorella desiccata (nom. nud.)]KAH7619424.1 hypothetical protein NADE_006266 [Chlorella desiccata (nom. nud.)]
MASILLRRQAASLPSLVHRSGILPIGTVGWSSAAAQQLVLLRNFSSSDLPPPPSSDTASTYPKPPSSTKNFKKNEGGGYIYEAPFSSAVRKVKRLSLFSCACAVAAGPVILGLDGGPTTLTAKLSIAGTLTSFGVFTTGLLHWFTHPYIHKLVHNPKENTIDINVLDLLGRSRTRHIRIADVTEAQSVHPLSSFAVNKNVFYLDRDHFKDKELLEKLAPTPPAAVEEGQHGEQATAANKKQQ